MALSKKLYLFYINYLLVDFSLTAHTFSLYADESAEDLLFGAVLHCLNGSIDSNILLRTESCYHHTSRKRFISTVFKILSVLIERHLPSMLLLNNVPFITALQNESICRRPC